MSEQTSLELNSISKKYGEVQALQDVSVSMISGEFVGLIGPNGAGKTTLINVIMGLTEPDKGTVRINGKEANGKPPHKRYDIGITKTFQETGLFPNLSVIECLLIGLDRSDSSVFDAIKAPDSQDLAQCERILKEVGLDKFRDQPASDLAHGQKKLLDLAMALSANPSLLLLDEPVAGLNPAATRQFMNVITNVHGVDSTFILIEHNIDVVMELCERVIVLNNGEIQLIGPPNEVENDPEINRIFFGGEEV